MEGALASREAEMVAVIRRRRVVKIYLIETKGADNFIPNVVLTHCFEHQGAKATLEMI